MSYSDLGNKLECGPDLVKSRCFAVRKPWLAKKIPNDPNAKIPTEIEKQLYRDFDTEIKFEHDMKLADGVTPWGGSTTFTITFTFSSHSQCRMDMRCVPYDEVISIIQSNFAKMERAWIDKDVSEYQRIWKEFWKGSEGEKTGLRGGDVRIPVTPKQAVKKMEDVLGDRAVSVPMGSAVSTIIKSVVAIGRVKKTKMDLHQEECVMLLSDMGYRVVRKKAHKTASPSSLRFNVKGGQWLGGFYPSQMNHIMQVHLDLDPQKEKMSYLEADLSKLQRAFTEWLEENLIEPASKDDIKRYLRNYTSLTEGSIEIEADDGVLYTIKRDSKEQPRLESAVLVGPTFKEPYDVKVPASSFRDTMEFFFVLTEVKGDERKEKELEEKKRAMKVTECIEDLQYDYFIYDPKGKLVK